MKTVIQPHNLVAFRLWLVKLGYDIKPLNGCGFVAKLKNKIQKQQTPKKHHYLLLTDQLTGNPAAVALGSEFEGYLGN
ncbi:response regulator [Acinetobacter sp. B5B]|uniref:response regulator n=1 Tax=Acinetobacter baretiae TaxID=2605383 RepID=UPI0018C2FEED|nr:response regulator [Acinetobacter baretiae]MBF7683888.1 response regulator [Acinetobacter baretiae]